MKKLIAISVLFCLAVALCGFQYVTAGFNKGPSGGSGPVFIAETAQALGTNGGTTTSINTSGANFLGACVTHLDSVTATLTDSAANTWIKVRTDDPGSEMSNDLYYVYAPATSASHTFSVSGTGGKSGVSVIGFSGIASNPLDQQVGLGNTSNNTSFGPGSMTPTTNNEVVIPCLGSYIAPTGATTSLSGYSGVQQYAYASTQFAGASAYLIQTTAAASNPSFSWTGTSAAQTASQASFISTTSTIANCSGCTYSTASTNSGGSAVVSDPTSFTASFNTGVLMIAFGWHTNFSGSGTTTTTDATGLQWHSCLDGSTNSFTDIKVSSTVGMSCNYAFTTLNANNYGATVVATDCASNCTTLGGVYIAFSGVFIPRAWDAFAHTTYPATSGTGSNNMPAGTIAPSQANDLFVTYCNTGSGASVGTTGTVAGTTPIAFTTNANINLNGTGEYAIYGSATSVAPTMSGSNSVGYGCMTVAFK